jgi:quinoprotein glucose dehydrogenase
MSPGVQGGTNWPGGSYDPDTHIVYVYAKNGVSLMGIVPNEDPAVSEFPYVHGVTGFTPRPQRAMGADYDGPPGGFRFPPPAPGQGPQPGRLFVRGLPLIKPPYGLIAAIDLTRGEIAWRIAHGETPDNIRNHPDLQGLEIPRTGREGNLGPLTTKSLVICGEAGFFTTPEGVRGAMLRAYDKATGEERGAVYMPAPQSGAPMTYMLRGRQYIVVAVSGGNYGGELLAFRLPEDAIASSRPQFRD